MSSRDYLCSNQQFDLSFGPKITFPLNIQPDAEFTQPRFTAVSIGNTFRDNNNYLYNLSYIGHAFFTGCYVTGLVLNVQGQSGLFTLYKIPDCGNWLEYTSHSMMSVGWEGRVCSKTRMFDQMLATPGTFLLKSHTNRWATQPNYGCWY